MESGFDKEIDVLLRNAAEIVGAPNGSKASPHPEIDAIAAYAENVIPKASRRKYTEHFADCQYCRRILANLIAMNASVEQAADSEAAPAGARIEVDRSRWRFFAPRAVFALGGLLVVLAGFLVYSALWVPLSGPTEISSFSEQELPMPAAATEDMPPITNQAAANSTFELSSNVGKAADLDAISAGRAETRGEKLVESPAPKTAQAQPRVLSESTADITVPGKSPGLLKMEPAMRSADEEIRRDAPGKPAEEENKIALGNESSKVIVTTAPAEQPETTDKDDAAAPVRKQNKTLDGVQLDGKDSSEMRTRATGGKTFENRNGIWYDSAYKGQKAKDVSRGTEAFRKLDQGLRAIASELKGTVVVVWNEKAYRIR